MATKKKAAIKLAPKIAPKGTKKAAGKTSGGKTKTGTIVPSDNILFVLIQVMQNLGEKITDGGFDQAKIIGSQIMAEVIIAKRKLSAEKDPLKLIEAFTDYKTMIEPMLGSIFDSEKNKEGAAAIRALNLTTKRQLRFLVAVMDKWNAFGVKVADMIRLKIGKSFPFSVDQDRDENPVLDSVEKIIAGATVSGISAEELQSKIEAAIETATAELKESLNTANQTVQNAKDAIDGMNGRLESVQNIARSAESIAIEARNTANATSSAVGEARTIATEANDAATGAVNAVETLALTVGQKLSRNWGIVTLGLVVLTIICLFIFVPSDSSVKKGMDNLKQNVETSIHNLEMKIFPPADSIATDSTLIVPPATEDSGSGAVAPKETSYEDVPEGEPASEEPTASAE